MTLIWLSLAWISGIVLAGLLPMAAWTILTLACVPLCIAAALRHRPRAALVVARLAIAAAGAWRWHAVQPAITDAHVASYNDTGRIVVQGTISREPSECGGSTQLTITCNRLLGTRERPQGRHLSGRILATVPLYPRFQYGDHVRLSGILRTPPVLDGFDYRQYLAIQGIHSTMYYPQVEVVGNGRGTRALRMLYAGKRRLLRRMEALLPHPEAGLLTGIVLGVSHSLPDDLYDAYRATGLAHIIVISGFNIGLLSQILLMLGHTGLHRWPLLWLNILLVGTYTVLVGPSPPVARAALMGTLAIVAQLVGRKAEELTSLGATAWMMTAINPLVLWSVSFQLSFASTLGMILLDKPLRHMVAEALQRLTIADGPRTLLREGAAAATQTMSAGIATLPIMCYTFGEVSLLALPANVLTGFAQPIIMGLGLLCATTASISRYIAQPIAWALWPLLRWTNLVVEALGSVPWASVPASPLAILGLAVPYAMLAAWIAGRDRLGVAWRWVRQHTPAEPLRHALIPCLLMLSVLLWAATPHLPDGLLHIYFLDVGQGDAILMRSPAGAYMLVDGGPDPVVLASRLGRVLPFWRHRLDLVLATHADSDHIMGLIPILSRYDVGWAAYPPRLPSSGALGQEWSRAVDEAGVHPAPLAMGTRIAFDDGLVADVLHPPFASDPGTTVKEDDDNASSVVLSISWRQFSSLLTGDVDAEIERRLVASGAVRPATVLKVAHHGSSTGTSTELLAAIRPAIAVVSAGAGNRHGHPAPEILARLEAAGCHVYRTDEHGTIEIITDGTRCWVRHH